MKEVTVKGQTVEEAIQDALRQLETSEDKVEVSIIEEAKKGLFGLFGTKPAVVKVVKKPNALDEAKQFLERVSLQMGVDIDIQVKQEGKKVTFTLSGEKIAILIGKRGQTLNSLQYLTQLVANRFADQYLMIMLDAEDYRQKRNDTLVQLAHRLADKAIRTRKEVALEPMPSYERKVLHAALVDNKKISTYSKGADPHRHLVIVPVK